MHFGFTKEEWKAYFWLKISILIYIIMLISFVVFEYSVLPYIMSIAAFLIISTYIFRSKSFPAIFLTKFNKMVIIFSLALLVRAIILLQDQIITNDLEFYVFRSKMMLAGRIPYIDFYGGTKPPLYNYMLYIMGYLFGPGLKEFRAVFLAADALFAVNLFLAGKTFFNENWGFRIGIIYALNPLNIITIGLSGHYEPVILLFVITSLIFYHKKMFKLSGVLLGTAFALKVFPIIFLPFILVTLRSWKERILYTILFAVPFVLSLVPLIILSPDAIWLFITEESVWRGSLTFSFLFIASTGIGFVFGMKATWIFLGFFAILIMVLLWSWIKFRDEDKHTIRWFKIMLILIIINYGIGIPLAFIYYGGNDISIISIALAIIITAAYLVGAIYFLKRFLTILIPENIHKGDHLIITMIFAMMLFIYGLPNFAPWYLLWYFPLVLLVKTNRIRLTLFWLMFWHHTGVAINLLPGILPLN